MNEPSKPFGEVFDAHMAAEVQTRDIEATMATMSHTPHVTHVPIMTGGHGRDTTPDSSAWPEDTAVTPLSRTVGENGLVDEVIITFTHDCEMPALLPGIKPT
jgi:carboxymethylenebutenolidase